VSSGSSGHPEQNGGHSLGPIDEQGSSLSTDVDLEDIPNGKPAAQRQDSTSSSAWLIPVVPGSPGSEYMLSLPPIGETDPDDYSNATGTVPRRGPRSRPMRPDQPVPANSDPPRRRHLRFDEPEGPTRGYPGQAGENPGSARENPGYCDEDEIAANIKMFETPLKQAEMLETAGIDSNIEHLVLPVSPTTYHWHPTELPPVDSYA